MNTKNIEATNLKLFIENDSIIIWLYNDGKYEEMQYNRTQYNFTKTMLLNISINDDLNIVNIIDYKTNLMTIIKCSGKINKYIPFDIIKMTNEYKIYYPYKNYVITNNNWSKIEVMYKINETELTDNLTAEFKNVMINWLTNLK